MLGSIVNLIRGPTSSFYGSKHVGIFDGLELHVLGGGPTSYPMCAKCNSNRM